MRGTFVLNEYESHNPKAATGRLLKVEYKGSEPPPDTFKDNSQALAEGTYGRDGELHATVLQAKCASKYAPATPNGAPAAAGEAGICGIRWCSGVSRFKLPSDSNKLTA